MGSFNSGRRGDAPLVEHCRALDLARLMRLGPLRVGVVGDGEFAWSRDSQRIGAIQFRLDLRDAEAATLTLRYIVCPVDEKQREISQNIRLVHTRPNFGGLRWWMRCPVTGERVRVLYLPPGGEQFAGRNALGLCYRVERLGRFDRPFEKLFRAQRKLGGSQGLATELNRPKGMWHRTHARHFERLVELDLACAQEISAFVERRMPAV